MKKRTLSALVGSLLLAVVGLTALAGVGTGSALADDGVGTGTPTQIVTGP
jgi:hypothetical protein